MVAVLKLVTFVFTTSARNAIYEPTRVTSNLEHFSAPGQANRGWTCSSTALPLYRLALIVLQQPAKPLVAHDIFGAEALDRIGRFVH